MSPAAGETHDRMKGLACEYCKNRVFWFQIEKEKKKEKKKPCLFVQYCQSPDRTLRKT